MGYFVFGLLLWMTGIWGFYRFEHSEYLQGVWYFWIMLAGLFLIYQKTPGNKIFYRDKESVVKELLLGIVFFGSFLRGYFSNDYFVNKELQKHGAYTKVTKLSWRRNCDGKYACKDKAYFEFEYKGEIFRNAHRVDWEDRNHPVQIHFSTNTPDVAFLVPVDEKK
ncbi:hypothetical protein [Pelagibaculum spongiae]|uniref:Uncharacterized protein n=1 Tax=Pelagibaculum spongiae TaxID=2080658 RepID=A0A2V1H650_9GAMM|nr:hypothetical protein [Pelagibaculum spongiae]PVZ71902.1 hypothetical protein DC094_02450 [Pelagibaculum spongiae]